MTFTNDGLCLFPKEIKWKAGGQAHQAARTEALCERDVTAARLMPFLPPSSTKAKGANGICSEVNDLHYFFPQDYWACSKEVKIKDNTYQT